MLRYLVVASIITKTKQKELIKILDQESYSDPIVAFFKVSLNKPTFLFHLIFGRLFMENTILTKQRNNYNYVSQFWVMITSLMVLLKWNTLNLNSLVLVFLLSTWPQKSKFFPSFFFASNICLGKFAICEAFCTIHSTIDISMMANKLGMNNEVSHLSIFFWFIIQFISLGSRMLDC